MKKILSAVLVMVMLLSMSAVAFAAEDTFVPSIQYKDAPEVVNAVIVEGEKEEKVTEGCLTITPVSQARQMMQQLPKEMTLLMQVYTQLNDGTMELPADKLSAKGLLASEAVIRDLVDMTWVCDEDPSHVDRLEKGAKLVVTYKMKGLDEGETICVMTYKNDEWNPIADVKNNGDGTITCTFDHLCPVAFVVGPEGVPPTGVEFSMELAFWMFALVASAATLVVVVAKRRKNA